MQDLAGEGEGRETNYRQREGEGSKQWCPCPSPLWLVVGGKGNAEVQELEEGPRGLQGSAPALHTSPLHGLDQGEAAGP